MNLWPGIDIDIPTGEKEVKSSPDDAYAAVKTAFEGGADGVILSRKYSEIRLENVRAAAGKALRTQQILNVDTAHRRAGHSVIWSTVHYSPDGMPSTGTTPCAHSLYPFWPRL